VSAAVVPVVVSDVKPEIAENENGAALPGTDCGMTSAVIAVPPRVVPPIGLSESVPATPTGMFDWKRTGVVVPVAVNAIR